MLRRNKTKALFISSAIFLNFGVQGVAENRPKIVGGSTAPINKFQFQVALVEKQLLSNFHGQFCGGSLINNNTVVTAAHCLDGENINSLQVLVGTHDLENGGERVNVASLIIHPRYSPENSGFDYDVAVIKLKPNKKQETLLNRLPKAKLPSMTSKKLAPGTPVRVSGWGYLEEIGDDRPSKLHHVSVNVIDQNTCISMYKASPITPRMICAGILYLGGKDACQRDSGGPLILNENVLVGIVSWGLGCGEAKFPGVYSNVTALREWIARMAW